MYDQKGNVFITEEKYDMIVAEHRECCFHCRDACDIYQRKYEWRQDLQKQLVAGGLFSNCICGLGSKECEC
eukprot:5812618-Pleurochrysis_carterae.AAC.1